jgi:hypothetical protein
VAHGARDFLAPNGFWKNGVSASSMPRSLMASPV